MTSNNELQNDEMYLPGDLGTVSHTGRERPIKSILKGENFTTLTIGPTKAEIIDTRDCVFDTSKINDRLKEIGALEDIDHEVIHPKHTT